MASLPHRGTPKRKLSELFKNDASPTRNSVGPVFSFELTSPSPVDDGSASPRTKVAHRFRGLALEGGAHSASGVATSAAAQAQARASSPSPPNHQKARAVDADDDINMDDDTEIGARKRVKLPEEQRPVAGSLAFRYGSPDELENDEVGSGKFTAATFSPIAATLASSENPTLDLHTDQEAPEAVSANLIPKKYRSSPSTNSAAEQNSPSTAKRRRAGTPLLDTATQRQPSPSGSVSSVTSTPESPSGSRAAPAPDEVVDPVRASLTWHEHEITVYDPDDSDDDGTGINGIGFKPTPAEAYARTVKRRQQLADYRKREEREARARRSQRRHGGRSSSPAVAAVGGLADLKEKNVDGSSRRVRFREEPGVTVC